MSAKRLKIAIVAPGTRVESFVADKVRALGEARFGSRAPDLHFHPQCYLSSGHFAGDDAARAQAFIEVANDESFDAVWIGRGGYGSCRIAERVIANLSASAQRKSYLGYSDAGSLLAALYKAGFKRLAHGPMPSDIKRDGGEAAVERALRYLVDRAPETLEPTVGQGSLTAAFNITILSHLLGTPIEPDLTGHILMLEDVSEYMYRIDRAMFHITSQPSIRRVAGIKLGRCSDIPDNDPDFGESEEQVVRHWCAVSGIAYLGRADIGHDIANKIVPFGRLPL
jgi:muramoyltetrapeptide carboxypeptidase